MILFIKKMFLVVKVLLILVKSVIYRKYLPKADRSFSKAWKYKYGTKRKDHMVKVIVFGRVVTVR